MQFRRGDLIVTEDGYYAIVIDPEDGIVRAANGCEMNSDLSSAKPVPLKAGGDQNCHANFEEIMKQPTWLEDMNELGRHRREREKTEEYAQ